MSDTTTARALTVVDLGGTNLRIGRFAPETQDVTQVVRFPSESLALYPAADPRQLQQRAVEQLKTTLSDYLDGPDGSGSRAVGVAFAGPVTADGAVLGAPTIWGPSAGGPLPLARILEDCLQVPVLVTNDITAAAWRYAPEIDEPFCLLTVSSGIGCKIFRNGEVLLDPAGHGGELGHWPVSAGADAPLCDCGVRGHLGALSSGRGILIAARRAAGDRSGPFGRSLLGELTDRRPERITNHHLVTAIRAADAFSLAVLRGSLRPLALAINSVFTSIGVRRFVIIGGFALAVGAPFIEHLTEELLDLGCFGLTASEIRGLTELGNNDDLHGLLGVGRMMQSAMRGEPVGAKVG